MLYFKAHRGQVELDRQAVRDGWPALPNSHPATAARLAPTDAQRIQRALEVHRLSGRPISELHGRREATAGTLGRIIAIALVPSDRAALHAAIALRFQEMLDAGLVNELRGLKERYALDPALPSMRSVGYRQAWQFLEGAIDASQLLDMGVAATRQLAKRQLTWLRSTPARVSTARPDLADAVSLAPGRNR